MDAIPVETGLAYLQHEFKNHDLVDDISRPGVRYEKRPAKTPDGKTVLITSNAANGYQNAGLLDIATKKIHWLTQDKWEVSGGGFSADGRHLVITSHRGASDDAEVHVIDLAGAVRERRLRLAWIPIQAR
jgi:dipeptidyl aminopeptidase/acylaminoacyl peptidase